ncbi:tRNA pseudouridine(55) synthase TruB [Oceanobacillus piezotolerans]|uniref:tRNA pseudouridine synthase B n=1 Tax=Oceanobacillus piezotolerans TaxID=2448030 RepID=A0A498D968_9BACI|nr:tRNA pseudouridine(55) synthase TruB [Oceanobacillus piezotolerans]RLL45357.1 tRNA pseudouridine(55) synthase TruB [Oceanobacillus piezotolerans]
MNGILPLWKPKGYTSHDCVMKIRKWYKTKKVGHTGTLDPEVEGMLPICIGQATKIVPFLTDTRKTYIATVQLGLSTDTEDATGEVIEEMKIDRIPTEEEVDDVLQSFLGTTKQIPPMYSAVKVNGKKLYEYARENKKVERPVREIVVYEIERLSKVNTSFRFRVICSKGTYIRTLCVDIGKKLGYPAHMSHLVRTETGSFTEKNAITFDMIEDAVEKNKQEELLSPMIKGLDHLGFWQVDNMIKRRVLNGQKLTRPQEIMSNDPFVIIDEQQRVIAIYQIHPEDEEQIKPIRVFSE